MEPEKRVLDVTSTLEGEEIGMTIDEGALAHIMTVLTDLYSNPELAVVRELSTNALDSHIEAGQTRPIEVTTPTSLAPFFRIRDYGTGLNVEDIKNIYSRYGASTRRGSNDVVGMLGLGSKSPLTYTDQFTVTGIKNGICTQVAVSRTEDGKSTMTIVDEYKTEDPSGVDITVPVKRNNHFEYHAKEFFRFWKPGTVLLNGAEPQRIDGLWISDDLLLAPGHGSTDYIVMGNVPYPIPTRVSHYYTLIAFVDIGAVNFTPSRESLHMTPKTKAKVAEVIERAQKERDAAFDKEIENCPNRWTAVAKNRELSRMGYHGKGYYKGDKIPNSVEAPRGVNYILADVQKYTYNKGWESYASINHSQGHDAVWLTDYKYKTLTPHKRKKLEQWVAKKGLAGFHYYVLVDELSEDHWLNPDMIFSWNEPDAEKIPSATNSGREDGRPSGAYVGNVDGAYVPVLLASDIDTTKPIFWTTAAYGTRSIQVIEAKHPKNYTVVSLSRNRVNKFKRDFPTALNFNTYIKEEAVAWKKSLTEEDHFKIHMLRHRTFSYLGGLDEKKIDDPELKKMVKVARSKSSRRVELADCYSSMIDIWSLKSPWNPEKKYALLTGLHSRVTISGKVLEHMYTYMNAVHATADGSN